MRKILSVAAVGLLTSISFAHAATPTTEPTAPKLVTVPYGAKYFCEFEGEGESEHGHQDRDFRCRVEGTLVGETLSANSTATPTTHENAIKIKCSNGYRLESEETAISFLDRNLWINAEKHDKLASIRIKDFLEVGAQEDGRRYKADILAANEIVLHGEGKCRFEFPVAPPPPAPSLAE